MKSVTPLSDTAGERRYSPYMKRLHAEPVQLARPYYWAALGLALLLVLAWSL